MICNIGNSQVNCPSATPQAYLMKRSDFAPSMPFCRVFPTCGKHALHSILHGKSTRSWLVHMRSECHCSLVNRSNCERDGLSFKPTKYGKCNQFVRQTSLEFPTRNPCENRCCFLQSCAMMLVHVRLTRLAFARDPPRQSKPHHPSSGRGVLCVLNNYRCLLNNYNSAFR
jgi:hypothetical protein